MRTEEEISTMPVIGGSRTARAPATTTVDNTTAVDNKAAPALAPHGTVSPGNLQSGPNTSWGETVAKAPWDVQASDKVRTKRAEAVKNGTAITIGNVEARQEQLAKIKVSREREQPKSVANRLVDEQAVEDTPSGSPI